MVDFGWDPTAVSDEPATATIRYRDQDGIETTECSACSATIGPGEAWRPDVAKGGIRAGTYGSAMVTSDGQPITAIVADFSYRGATDLATYNGISITDDAPTENFLPFTCGNAR